MPFIRPRMNGDTLCTITLAPHRSQFDIRHIASARIAKGGNLVDINTQSGHCFYLLIPAAKL
jgi:hypothetical protein